MSKGSVRSSGTAASSGKGVLGRLPPHGPPAGWAAGSSERGGQRSPGRASSGPVGTLRPPPLDRRLLPTPLHSRGTRQGPVRDTARSGEWNVDGPPGGRRLAPACRATA